MKRALLLSLVLFALPAATAGATVNDYSCKPPAAHPSPVVLVHGTFADSAGSWNLVAPALEQQGYCVFEIDYGNNATGEIAASAAQLRDFVDHVLAATGAATVSIVGHSQGGMMPRYYIKNLGGDTKVDDLVGLAPSNHGTTNQGAQWASWCAACQEQEAGSPFLTALNSGDESPGAVSYTQIETRYDEVVTPYTSAFLAPDAGVTNVLLQDKCPPDVSDHLGIGHDPIALAWVEDALGRPGPADPAFDPGCQLSASSASR